MNNLANDPKFAAELKRHRKLLNDWIKETGDKGQIPESEKSLRAAYQRWGKKCVNPEFDMFKKDGAEKKQTQNEKPAPKKKVKKTLRK